MSPDEYPFDHISHDWIWDVDLDKPYYDSLNSSGNEKVNGRRLMEMEWDTNQHWYSPPRGDSSHGEYFSYDYYPGVGDRVWMLGRWVFDCGHRPYKTEIHPAKVVAFTKDRPIVLPGDTAPSQATFTYMFAGGRGGYYNSPVNTGTYRFDVPYTKNLGFPSKGTLQDSLVANVFRRDSGTPAPILTQDPLKGVVHVAWPLKVGARSVNRRFAAVVVTAQRLDPIQFRATRFRVTLQNIKVLDDHDSLGSGEWRLWLFPGIGWTVPGGDARNTLEDVDSGQTVPLNLTYEFVVGLSGFSIRTSGWESDLYDDIFRTGSPVFPRNAFEQGIFQDPLEQNDGIGRVSQHFVGLPSSAGTYDTPSSNKDFRLRYKVEVVQDYPVGTPLR